MTGYLVNNWAKLASATDALKEYVQIYQIGGATAIELIGSIAATLSAGDWALLLGAIGVTTYAVASQIRCFAIAASS
jgi:hypothetical protein